MEKLRVLSNLPEGEYTSTELLNTALQPYNDNYGANVTVCIDDDEPLMDSLNKGETILSLIDRLAADRGLKCSVKYYEIDTADGCEITLEVCLQECVGEVLQNEEIIFNPKYGQRNNVNGFDKSGEFNVANGVLVNGPDSCTFVDDGTGQMLCVGVLDIESDDPAEQTQAGLEYLADNGEQTNIFRVGVNPNTTQGQVGDKIRLNIENTGCGLDVDLEVTILSKKTCYEKGLKQETITVSDSNVRLKTREDIINALFSL